MAKALVFIKAQLASGCAHLLSDVDSVDQLGPSTLKNIIALVPTVMHARSLQASQSCNKCNQKIVSSFHSVQSFSAKRWVCPACGSGNYSLSEKKP